MTSLCLVPFALCPAVTAQQQPTFRAGTRTVSVSAVVTDEWSRAVMDLTRDEFQILDNGKPQPITVFDQESRPVTAQILLDGSASTLQALDVTIAEVDDFIVRLMPGDRARLGSFSEDINLGQDFTDNRDHLLGFFSNQFNVHIGRRTRLWDAMDAAITALSTLEGRRIVVVFTDGVDTWSLTRFGDVEGRARHFDVGVYAIITRSVNRTGQMRELTKGPDGSAAGEIKPNEQFALRTLAEETGGSALYINQADEARAPFTRLSRELHSQYVLGFVPAALDGKVHKIEVRVTRKNLTVRARKSYMATEDSGK